MAMDWTYDLFVEDAELYKATPIKGVNCPADADWRQRFMTWFKNCARDFLEAWDAPLYDRRRGWVGDAFARELGDMCFSDYYKDAYGQRPHLPDWFYVQAVGLPMSEDVARCFCSDPVGDAVMNAKSTREYLEAAG